MLYDAIAGSNGFYNSPVDPGACTCLAQLAALALVAAHLPLKGPS